MTLEWRRSSACESSACVEVAIVTDGAGGVLLRKTKHPPAISFTREEWGAFIEGAKRGDFDWPQE